MALDIVVLGPSGAPAISVPVGLNMHVCFLKVVEGADCPLLARLHDYYADVKFESNELDRLLAELETVTQRAQGDRPIAALSQRITELVRAAQNAGERVLALAD